MNKVITINLDGFAYQLEEGGYDALRAYLETATARLAGNPDREEILSDIERAIADKFRALLASHKTVVEAKEGYYEAMKNFPDRKARREWQRKFKREMRANADQWRHNWYSYWAERAPVHPGMGFALPFLSLLNGAALILFICTLFSVLATGSVFGRPLPGDLPVWGAAVVLLLV